MDPQLTVPLEFEPYNSHLEKSRKPFASPSSLAANCNNLARSNGFQVIEACRDIWQQILQAI